MEVQIEPFGSIRIVRFDRVTGPTAGFGGSWPVLILNGLISRSDRNCDRSTVEPVGPAGPVFKTLTKSKNQHPLLSLEHQEDLF